MISLFGYIVAQIVKTTFTQVHALVHYSPIQFYYVIYTHNIYNFVIVIGKPFTPSKVHIS